MSCLTAVVPEAEVRRSEIVAARLARKVAPLFGVRWAGNPFGRTWVCDLASVTLAEIGRGAPCPAKAVQPAAHEPTVDGPWAHVGRGVWTPDRTATPGALPAATLNRFGPDTKAAVVLTAANRLLMDATAGVAEVSRHLAEHGVHPVLRLTVWAGLVAEVYRAQPALVIAAVQARAVQRSLSTRWRENVTRPVEAPLPLAARCELPLPARESREDRNALPARPVNFDLIDATLPLLDLRLPSGGSAPEPLVPDRLDDLADAWCRRLWRLGAAGHGIVWLSETAGHRRAEAYLRVGAQVAPFVAEVLDGVPPLPELPLWQLPSRNDLRPLPVQSRRAHIVAVHVAVNFLRYRDDLLQACPTLRDHTRKRLDETVDLAIDALGPEDPATLLIRGYTDYLRVWDRLQTVAGSAGTLEDDVEQLRESQERLLRPAENETLDDGTLTYLLEVGNVALAAASARLARPAAVERTLAKAWSVCLSLRGLSAQQVLSDPEHVHPAQAFHLQHFAAYQAQLSGPKRLRQAYALQSRICDVRDDVARREPVSYAAKHTASRNAHELAAPIALALADSLPLRESTARAAALAHAVRHAVAVLDNPTTGPLVRSGEPPSAVVAAARSVIPALLARADTAATSELLTSGQRDLALALLDAATRAADRLGDLAASEELSGWGAQLRAADGSPRRTNHLTR